MQPFGYYKQRDFNEEVMQKSGYFTLTYQLKQMLLPVFLYHKYPTDITNKIIF